MNAPAKAGIVWPDVDVVIEERQPDRNFCGDVNNRIEYNASGQRIRTLIGGIYVPISQADRDTLHIRNGGGTTGGTHRISAYLITSSWNECTVTWSSQPSYDLGVKGEFIGSLDSYWKGDGWWFAIPITDIVRAWLTGRSNYGIMLEMTPLYGYPDANLTFKNEDDNQGPNITYDGQVHAPNACFTANPQRGPAPLTVTFTNCTQDAYLYNWEFGDGGQSYDQNPQPHTYTSEGTYTVWLTAQNDNESDRVKQTITVDPKPIDPICTIDHDQLNFPDTEVNDCSTAQTFSITNTGGGTLSGNVSAPGCVDWRVTNAGSFNLGADQSKTVTVEFCPKTTGDKVCTIDTGTDKCAEVTCRGKGIPGNPVYVHPYYIDFDAIDVRGTTYPFPDKLPDIEAGESIVLHATLRDATGKAIPWGAGGDTLVVFDFLEPLPQCSVPPVVDASGRFEYETRVGPSVNSTMRCLFIRTTNFNDLPLLVVFYINLDDDHNLLSQSYLDDLSEEIKRERDYSDIGFVGLTALDEFGRPIASGPDHFSEAIQPAQWSDIVTSNTYPAISQLLSWYNGIAGIDAFGPHLEVINLCEGDMESEQNITTRRGPIHGNKVLLLAGSGFLCLAPPGWAVGVSEISCVIAVQTLFEIAEDIAVWVNENSEENNPGDRAARGTAIKSALDLSTHSRGLQQSAMASFIGEGIDYVDEEYFKQDVLLKLDFILAAKKRQPFPNCTVEEERVPVGFDYFYSLSYGAERMLF
ncbi:MAG: DNRLRE domain-containing protein, partial [Candidatus Kerfeldbacteria bacterium]|nr:DNRLRE domain-containing protein [Candidatus Kerfeldbacteria bacterium]